MKKAISVLLGALMVSSALDGGAQAQDGSGPFMTFTVRGVLEIKQSTGVIQRAEYESYHAPKSLGEEIAAAPNPIQCEERDAKPGEATAPVVTFTTPKFSLKEGSTYCKVISKFKRAGITFKIKTEVGGSGVTG